MNRLTTSLLAALVVNALVAGRVAAQAPLQFANTPEAVRLYEEGLLEQLRTKCSAKKYDGLLGREELTGLRNGYITVYEHLPEPGRYSVFAYDQDKRSFVLIDGQRLTRNVRLTLKLALPRDFARCRVVRDATGFEQIEVVHRETTAASESQVLDRFIKDAAELSAQLAGLDKTSGPAVVCAAPGAGQAPAPADRTVVLSKVLEHLGCRDAAIALRERMDRLVRRVFER